MEQISNTVAIISGGEPIPAGFEDGIKIALMGSSDLNVSQELDWYSKFAQGVALITNTDPGKGIIMYRGMKFLLMSCKSWNPSNPIMSYNNPEFITKMSADLDYAAAADCIFFNFLKKSTAQMPLTEFCLVSQSGKVICRCPNDYVNYGVVRCISERYNIPLLPGATTSVLSVLQTMWAFIPKFQEVQRFKLPE